MAPMYRYRCPKCGMEVDQFHAVKDLGVAGYGCYACSMNMEIVIMAPLLVKASPDVSYDSPIDGRPITSMQARQEDLKRSGCRPYDPDQKTELDRKVKSDEAALDRDIEATVEEAVTKMDGEGRRRLASELLDQGMTADTVRTTPHA